jgi:glycoside/pentoside/hexuronide:cation symporter, GPH family
MSNELTLWVNGGACATGLRHEGLFCALFVFFGKLAAGLGLAGSSLMLEFAGFDSEFGAQQPPSVALTLRFLVGIVPLVLVTISAGLLYFYPITEARRQNTRRFVRASSI